jgi:hypothetical protein
LSSTHPVAEHSLLALIKNTHKAPFPGTQCSALAEPVATDTVYASTPC